MPTPGGEGSLPEAFNSSNRLVCIDSPIFTPNACEGTSTLFQTNYFDRLAFLTQSGQLYAEASAMALGKVYCFGPTFRAEKSKTRRHLTEFWMLEPEMVFADLGDVMQLAEDMLVSVVRHVLEHRRPELEALERDLSKLEAIQSPFPRITYDEAAAILKDHPESEFTHGSDLGAPDETILSNRYDRPVMVTHYPAAVKAFYMKADPEKMNPWGGAIALGHPLGSSGTRLLGTLVEVLEAQGGRYGLQTMCEAGGLANATVIERC